MRWLLFILMAFGMGGPAHMSGIIGLRGGLLMNEILVDPNSASFNVDTDGNGAASSTDEFLELFNSGSEPIMLDGLELWRATGRWFTFPAQSLLAPGGYGVVVTGVQPGGQLPDVLPGSLVFDAGRGSGAFVNGGDNVIIYDSLSDTYLQLLYNGDAVDDPVLTYPGFSATATPTGPATDFGLDQDGVSLARHPAGAPAIRRHVDIDGQPASPGFPAGGPTKVRLRQIRAISPGPPYVPLAVGVGVATTSIIHLWQQRRRD